MTQFNAKLLNGTSAIVLVDSIPAATNPILMCYITGLYLAKALIGTLTVTGIVDQIGSAQNWVLPIGSVGTIVTAGKIACRGLTLTLSSASDNNVPLITWEVV